MENTSGQDDGVKFTNGEVSPPPPSPPDATQPGPRAQALQQAFSYALKATLSKVTYAKFAECFPHFAATPASCSPMAGAAGDGGDACDSVSNPLRDFWQEFIERLGQACHAQFNEILVQKRVVTSLNALDRIISQARERRARATCESNQKNDATSSSASPLPHLLSPHELTNLHLRFTLTPHINVLAADTVNLQAENVNLYAHYEQQLATLRRIYSTVTTTVDQVRKASQSLDKSSLSDSTLPLHTQLERQILHFDQLLANSL